VWDGTTFDHIFTISAHPAGISCITYAIVVEPPDPGVISKGTIVFTGATDGRVRAWNADTGGLWELQPPEPDFGPLHHNGIKALQFVCVTPTSVPPSSYAAPLDSGVFPVFWDVDAGAVGAPPCLRFLAKMAQDAGRNPA
jgi:WD40 repeat protein